MAMGGSYNNKGNRVRPIGVMLLVAFGAAMLGVMVVHKLRERRIFHLLVKEKDRDLVSLHLLLQKERDLGQEMKRKNEEMRGKILALTTHEAEMRSTIAFLKDEQRSVALALQEKQSEIKMLKEKEGDSQLATNPTVNVNVTVGDKDKEDETEQDSESSQSASVGGSHNVTESGGAFGGIANVTETRNEHGELNGEILHGDSSRGKGRSRRMYARHRRSEKNGDGARIVRRSRSRRLYKEGSKVEMSKAQGEDQDATVFKTRNDAKIQISEAIQSPTRDEEEGHTQSKAEHSSEAQNRNPQETKDQVASTVQVKEEASPEKDGEEVKVGEEHEDQEIADKEEKTDFFRSNSDEEYKEETDESEF